MAHRVHNVHRPGGGTVKVGAKENLPEQIALLYEDLTERTRELNEEIERLRERLDRLEQGA